MTYQELAGWYRANYPTIFGEEEDDKLVVGYAMELRPDDMDWEREISNFNEFQGLTEEGAPLPVAGYLKQLGFKIANIAATAPQRMVAPQAATMMEGARGEATTTEDIRTLMDLPEPWESAPEDREEGLGALYMRSMGNLYGAIKGTLGSPIDKAMAVRRLLLQTTGAISPEMAEKAVMVAENLRKQKNEWRNEWIDSDPEILGYLEWNKESPLTLENFLSGNAPDVFMRGLIEAGPSLAAFVAANYAVGPAGAMGVAYNLGKMGVYDETMSVLVDEMGIPAEEAIGYANDISTIAGGAEMVLESIGGFGVAKALGKDKVAKSVYDRAIRKYLINLISNPAIRKKLQSETGYTIMDALWNMPKEWLTESYQEQHSYLAVEAAKQGYGNGDPKNALADITKQYGDYLASSERRKEVYRESGAASAGFIGAIASVSMSSIGVGPSILDDYRHWKQQKVKRAKATPIAACGPAI